MNVGELERALFEAFPARDAEPWDRVGLSVGDPDAEVAGVACALDATVASLDEAVRRGANVLVTHHPVYLSAPDRFCPAAPGRPSSSATVFEAARRGVGIISMHTNLDRSCAARTLLPRLMELTASTSLEWAEEPERTGIGGICEIDPITVKELALRAQEAFATCAQAWGRPDALVRRIAFVGGSLGDFGELALEQGCDAVVTGELGYHRAQDLALRGLSVVLLGHDRIEQPFCHILADATAHAGVAQDRIHIISLPQQWWAPSQGGHA